MKTPSHSRCMRWAAYLKEIRKRRGHSRRKLAELADIDPSYVTLMERDGYRPKRDVVAALAKALRYDENIVMAQAGYATEAVVNAYLKSIGLKVTPIRKTPSRRPARQARELVAAHG